MKKLLTLLMLLCSCTAFALAEPSPKELERLGNSKQWRQYLYLDNQRAPKPNRRIQGDQYYFSNTPHVNSVVELTLSYQKLFRNLNTITDDSLVCRFPARFMFIDQQLSLNSGINPLTDCPALRKWSENDSFRKIMIVKIDSYFGNPASSFGHLVLRMSKGGQSKKLLDSTINYGARVPPNENIAVYIFKGLTGGYVASFSQEDFYRQDLVYTRTEFRDMWSYEINLTDRQRQLFLAHIWELMDQTSTYFFVKNNCAFAIAEVLELVTGYDFVSNKTLYYPPARLFHELDEYDARSPGSLVKSRTYIPSQDKLLKQIMRTLEPEESKAVRRYIKVPDGNIENMLADYSPARQSQILEVLLEYYDYMIAGYPELGDGLSDQRIDIIKARLRRPIGKTLGENFIAPPKRAPGATFRTTKINFSVGREDNDFYSAVSVAPFSLDPLDLGNEQLSEMTVLQAAIEASPKTKIDNVTLIRVGNRSPTNDISLNAWPISWSVDLGINCLFNCDQTKGIQAGGGLGQSLELGPTMHTLLANLDVQGSVVSIGGKYELAYAEQRRISGLLTASYRYPINSDDSDNWALSSTLRYSFNPRSAVQLSLQQGENHDRIVLGWLWGAL